MPYKNKEDRNAWFRTKRKILRLTHPDGRHKNGKTTPRDSQNRRWVVAEENKDRMMLLGTCNACNYENESKTAICSKILCPLMVEDSPFKFPFSDGRRPQIQKEPKDESQL
jgi:hypothetical protein